MEAQIEGAAWIAGGKEGQVIQVSAGGPDSGKLECISISRIQKCEATVARERYQISLRRRLFDSRKTCLVTNGLLSSPEDFSSARHMAPTSSLMRTGLTR